MEMKSKLKDIEKRLLEIEREKPMHINDEIHDVGQDVGQEKVLLQLERQFILDQRNGWKTKSIWDVIVPIAVSVITAYLVSIFITKMPPLGP